MVHTLSARAYFNPSASQADRGIPFMVSEIGGIGWATEGLSYNDRVPRRPTNSTPATKEPSTPCSTTPNLFGFCYTQLTDIEQERNGLYFYDRRPKFDVKRLHAIISRQAAYERGELTPSLP